jgi:hypothetical protein
MAIIKIIIHNAAFYNKSMISLKNWMRRMMISWEHDERSMSQ